MYLKRRYNFGYETLKFGYKTRIDETKNGFVTGYELYKGNPADDELLVSAVEQHIHRFGSVPKAVATDRGFGSKKNETKLKDQGVGRVCIPFKGKKKQEANRTRVTTLVLETCNDFEPQEKQK